MEYGSDRPQKRVIDCLAEEEEQGQTYGYLAFENCDNDNAGYDGEENDSSYTGFLLRDLWAENLDVDYFCGAEETQRFNEAEILVWACSLLKYSPTARALLKEAAGEGWSITLEDRDGGDYCMNVEEQLLTIDNGGLSGNALARSEYFMNRLLINISKALRDAWQEKRFGGFDEDYGPKDVVLMERVRFADLDTMSILIAWELREAGYEECWRYLSGSETGDMTSAFSACLERRPAAALDLRQSLQAAFKQWFGEDSRINACDHDTLDYMDDVLAASPLVNPFGHKRPGRMNIEMLSTMPGGAAYLQGQGGEILGSRIYTALISEINTAHLTHIVHDIETITVEHVSFRDPALARKLFPENFA